MSLPLTKPGCYCLVYVLFHAERQAAVQFARPVPSQVCQNLYLMSEGQATKYIYSLRKQAMLLIAGTVHDSAGNGTVDSLR